MQTVEHVGFHYTPGEKRAIISMYCKGMKIHDLERGYGVTPVTLREWMKELRGAKPKAGKGNRYATSIPSVMSKTRCVALIFKMLDVTQWFSGASSEVEGLWNKKQPTFQAK